MHPREIESWTLRVSDQVARHSHSEDALVELKSSWPEAANAARKIAAHANAARGATILWIIGIDEQHGVCGAELLEVADWFGAVKTHFDGAYPDLTDINVLIGNKTIVALAFRTDRAPYLVKNPNFGQVNGGSIKWEVPWREGRSTRTATREDLVRLLAPLMPLPEVECLEFAVRVAEEWTDAVIQTHKWYVDGSLYIAPASGVTVTIPAHRAMLQVHGSNAADTLHFQQIIFHVHDKHPGNPVTASQAGATIRSPGLVLFSSSISTPISARTYPRDLLCELLLPTVGGLVPCRVNVSLGPKRLGNGEVARWSLIGDA